MCIDQLLLTALKLQELTFHSVGSAKKHVSWITMEIN